MLHIILYDPLEQFEVYPLFRYIIDLSTFQINNQNFFQHWFIDLSITNFAIYTFLISIFSYGLLMHIASEPAIVPSKWDYVLENIYKFIVDMYKQKIGTYYQKYFSFVFTLFIFILIANLVGLMPYGFTITSHLFTTFFFSLSIFTFLISTGLLLQGRRFFLLFVPTGVPAALLPFLIIIEVISYFARALSLAVRLFANMMAGHSLLNIIASFVLRILNNTYWLGIAPLFLLIILIGLEIGIAFVQAYVFTILVCIYINDSVNGPSH